MIYKSFSVFVGDMVWALGGCYYIEKQFCGVQAKAFGFLLAIICIWLRTNFLLFIKYILYVYMYIIHTRIYMGWFTLRWWPPQNAANRRKPPQTAANRHKCPKPAQASHRYRSQLSYLMCALVPVCSGLWRFAAAAAKLHHHWVIHPMRI